MTRLLIEHDWRLGRGGDASVSSEDEGAQGRSGHSLHDDAGGARVRRPREDPSGRRSLTGLEFRRQ